jgi:hypothetical protein
MASNRTGPGASQDATAADAREGPFPRPNLFIIGAPKSGTTSLWEYLAGHPDVYMSPVKEPAYFSPDVPAPLDRFPYGAGEQRYLRLFAGATTERWRGEASTYYLFSRKAPGYIHQFEPNARIVAVLRNPVDAMHAFHSQLFEHGHEPIPDFDAALAADLAPDFGGHGRQAMVERFGTYRARGRYAEQLAPWLETFPGAQSKIFIFDDLVADTPGVLRQLLDFLDVDADYLPPSLDARNKSHQVRTLSVRLMRSAPARWLRHAILPHVVGEGRAASLGRRFKQSRLVRTEKERPPLTAQLRARLEEEFAPDVERLSAMLDRDLLGEWCGPGRQAIAGRPLVEAGR